MSRLRRAVRSASSECGVYAALGAYTRPVTDPSRFRARLSAWVGWASPPSPHGYVEEDFGVDEVGGIEAFGEPVVDVREHRARLIALALLVE
jgi:hypothetical protein